MRIDLKKYLFIGFKGQKEAFFKSAQELGIIHFINMQSKVKELPDDVNELNKALKILRGQPVVEQESAGDYALADGLSHKIVTLKHDLETLAEEERVLKLEIARVEIFGRFSVETLQKFEKEGRRVVQFFYAKQGFSDEPNLPEGLIFIGSENSLDYFIAINRERVAYERMIEMQIPESVGTLKEKRAKNKADTHAAEQRLKGYAKYHEFLQHALIAKLNHLNLYAAKNSAKSEMDGGLFIAEGWVPVNKVQELLQLAEASDVHVEEVAIEETDAIPTCLENEGMHRIGEDLVHIYDTPSHTDKDPSLWVLLSFSLFFGLIIGDAGYGLVFLAVALYVRYKSGPLKDAGKRIWTLLVILSSASIFWGLFSHSFFGIEMHIDNSLRKVSTLDWLAAKKVEFYVNHPDETLKEWEIRYPQIKGMKDPQEILHKAVKEINGNESHELVSKLSDGILMELALLIGITHIILGFLRYLGRQWAGLGWVIFLIGCYLYFPSYLGTISMTNYIFGVSVETAARDGMILIWVGVALAFILGIIKDKIYGLLQVMNLIQVFGDVLSYLRLYALGLAGAIVMSTINEFAASLHFVLGAVLFVIGHLTNMALGIMGGFIHGLRLNFIEWYHYSFEGGGKMFDPLRKLIP